MRVYVCSPALNAACISIFAASSAMRTSPNKPLLTPREGKGKQLLADSIIGVDAALVAQILEQAA